MDLNTWSPEDHHANAGQVLLMQLGATPYRCEYCRVNFVSFRQRREKFSFKRWRKYRRYQKDAAGTRRPDANGVAEEAAEN
ncbi:MAG: hypothetical protein FJW34_23125 [Acidobacteria bacterium]|nr:hypothetical protein [Acidobacteriota bacterium]